MNKVLSAVLSLCFVTAAAVPAFADTTLYTNGPGVYLNPPADNNLSSQNIKGSTKVSDSFILLQSSTITSADVSLSIFSGDTLSSLDWAITSAPLGGTTLASGTVTPVITTLGSIYGYDEDDAVFSISGVSLGAGTYYFQLNNAVASFGDQTFWDDTDGPSTAVSSDYGSVPSNAFTLFGSGAVAPTPEPSSVAFLGTGLLGMGGMLRRKFTTRA